MNFTPAERLKPKPFDAHHHKGSTLPQRTREHYVQSHVRFILSPRERTTFDQNPPPDLNYEAKRVSIELDVDAMMEWNIVEQVELLTRIEDCPICLEIPTVPKMTRCGHVFCWPCILRYFVQSDDDSSSAGAKTWRRCPMCFEPMTKSALKSVRRSGGGQNTGEAKTRHIEFQLLRRAKGSLFPTLESRVPRTTRSPVVETPDAKYSRIQQATVKYIEDFVALEREELLKMQQQTVLSRDQGYLPFIEEALIRTQDRLHRLHASSLVPCVELKSGTGKIGESLVNEYCFYQCDTGEFIILHPFNMKCLVHTSPESLPTRVSGQVLDMERIVLDEVNRKKYRFLSHLPLLFEFQLCEIDCRAILSSETKQVFQLEFKKRKKKRHDQRLKLKKTLLKEEQKQRASASADSMVNYMEDLTLFPSPPTTILHGEIVENEGSILNQEQDSHSSNSFATITQQNGYFPNLVQEQQLVLAPPVPQRDHAWGKKPPAVDPPPGFSHSKAKQKGGKRGTKGVSLFSTTQQRSYR